MFVTICSISCQVGFEMIDHIAQAQRIAMNTIQSKALIGIGSYSVDFFFNSFFLLSFLLLCCACCLVVCSNSFYDQYRFHWRGADFVGKTSGIHEFQWGIG